MSVQTQQIHRRKSSKEDSSSTNILITPAPTSPTTPTTPTVDVTIPEEHNLPSVTISAPPVRTRTQSTPQPLYAHGLGGGGQGALNNGNGNAARGPPSAGPYRSTFAPRLPLNGHGHAPLASPLRSSFSPMAAQMNMNGHGHSRARSISTPFSPVSPSPLSASFPSDTMSMGAPRMQTSHSASEALDGQHVSSFPSSSSAGTGAGGTMSAAGKQHARRHSRMHSRNLSVFFPRPGSLPHSAISEDGSQELEVPTDIESVLVPSAGSSVNVPGRRTSRTPITPLGQGFTFGEKPPSLNANNNGLPTPELIGRPPSASSISSSTSTSKRGHHHKHSMSHNFFSFLEPTSPHNHLEDLHTQPTVTPVSPWGPISAIPPDSAMSASTSMSTSTSTSFKIPQPPRLPENKPEISTPGLVSSTLQFALGAYLWVVGQQVGSLSVTGLGYWVVFDALGVALAWVVPGWLVAGETKGVNEKEKERIRRPYGTGRIETVLMFAQAVYLMFSSVYVCKETVEHLLLSSGGASGGGDGHHHHHGDEEGLGIDFPIFTTFITFVSLIATAACFESNTKIVNITGNQIPSLSTLLRSVWSPSRHANAHEAPPTGVVGRILANPFVVSPLAFCVGVLFVALALPAEQHRVADLALAMLIAVLTFKVAYRACVVLGAVLLQTSPPRGLVGGKMEAFLRVMREVERHPHVLHLPAPHIWQLTPSLKSSSSSTYTTHSPTSTSFKNKNHPPPAESLVVTLELHVREDLGDDDVLKLTRWAWERCVGALGSLRDLREEGEEGVGGPEVTVGVVKG